MHRTILATIALLAALPSVADTISGRVVGISDGDTLTILQGTTEKRIRLAAIDAPEKAQPYGQRSKQALSSLCFNKPATSEVVDIDRYGRFVSVVSCAGVNANETQVKTGMAWIYRKYAKGFGHLYPLEDEARAHQRGLWADDRPMEPWLWRKAKRASSS